jgi:hypothetical protein
MGAATTSELDFLSSPAWGAVVRGLPSAGHPIANAACEAIATQAGVYFQAGSIDALIRCEGQVLRIATCDVLECGIAQLRRRLEADRLAVLHLIFAPARPRPLLLSLVRLLNRSDEPLELEYSELWDVGIVDGRSEHGAHVGMSSDGARALADLSVAIRFRPPDPLPESGLALEARIVLPPAALRSLSFAYVAPRAGESDAPLIQAWRGDVEAELVRSVQDWTARLPSMRQGGSGGDAPADPVLGYRFAVGVNARASETGSES